MSQSQRSKMKGQKIKPTTSIMNEEKQERMYANILFCGIQKAF